MKYDILNRFSGAVQFSAEIECKDDASTSVQLGLAVTVAVKADANLSCADLSGADLSHANLIDGGQRSDGHRFVGWIKEGVLQIRAGCRSLSIADARAHWDKTRGGTPLGDETFAILNHIETVARIRKLVMP